MAAMADWYVYIIRCADDTLYTGIATDVERRFGEHRTDGKRAAKYLRGRAPLTLVYQKKIGNRSLASKVEYRIKKLSKADKEGLLSDPSIMTSILLESRATD